MINLRSSGWLHAKLILTDAIKSSDLLLLFRIHRQSTCSGPRQEVYLEKYQNAQEMSTSDCSVTTVYEQPIRGRYITAFCEQNFVPL